MLVHRIKEFAEKLSTQKKILSEIDLQLLEDLTHKFAEVVSDMPLQSEDFDWLQNCFATRWSYVFDKKNLDYTFNSQGINALWIQLAQELATFLSTNPAKPKEELTKNYLQILIPVLQNLKDEQTFVKLGSIKDPALIYIDDNNHIWHDIYSLHSYNQQVLSVIDDPKHKNRRGLTLTELNRLRNKKTQKPITTKNEHFESIWDYIKKKAIPQCSTKINFPGHLLVALFGVVEAYYNEKEELRQKVNELKGALGVLSVDEINRFYGTRLFVAGKQEFLVDILLDCWVEDEDRLATEFKALAEWLALENPSFIIQNDALTVIYEKLHLGKYFSWQQFSTKLTLLLSTDNSPSIDSAIKKLIGKISRTKQIDSIAIDDMRKIYAAYWQDIKDREYDYFRGSSKNKPWVKLAEILAGSGLIQPNYYKLLIPTLVSDNEKATSELLVSFPLEQYILSNDGTELIHLPSSIAWAKGHNIFLNLNDMVPLTPLEVNRLKCAAAPYVDFFNALEEQKKEMSLSKEMLLKILELVNQTLFVSGLSEYDNVKIDGVIRENEITKKIRLAATPFYEQFAKYYSESSIDEKARFDSQLIQYNFQTRSAVKILNEAIEGLGCLPTCSQLFAKLVIDYQPQTEFENREIEQSNWIGDMRKLSQRKVIKEYDIGQKEAIRRLEILMVSLLTHAFEFPMSLIPKQVLKPGHQIQFWDCENTVTTTGKNIFSTISDLIELGDLKDAPFIYQSLFENVINPAIINGGVGRTMDTSNWLNKIADKSLFKSPAFCFDTQHLFIQMLKFRSKNPVKVGDFLDCMINNWQQSPEKSFKKSIRINIKLQRFIKSLGADGNELLTNLRAKQEPGMRKSEFIKIVKNYILETIASRVVQKGQGFSFFGNGKTLSRDEFIRTFEDKLALKQDQKKTSLEKSDNISVRSLLIQLKDVGREMNGASIITLYLNELTKPIEDTVNYGLKIR